MMLRILVVNYFDIKSSGNAYAGILRDWEDRIQVEYNCDSAYQLSSINESPDSAGSEKSEEGSSNESERQARESLENTKEKLKQEYESLDEEEEAKMHGLPTSPKTMPLPHISAFTTSPVQPALMATTQFPLDQSRNFSDSSFDNDTLNEGYLCGERHRIGFM